MPKPNLALIRERCTYPRPVYIPPSRPPGAFTWKFVDRFGNQRGRLFCRPHAGSEAEWTDLYGRDMHQGGFLQGSNFAIAAVHADDAFVVLMLQPNCPPRALHRSSGLVTLGALSPDERYVLVHVSPGDDSLRPALLVLDREGRTCASLPGVAGVDGCWDGCWAPAAGGGRVIVHHEASGFRQPALWHPFANRTEIIDTGLEGEVTARWGARGDVWILRRTIEGRSDLHRFDLATRRCARIQPCDGTIWQFDVDADDAVTGVWTANHAWGQVFRESERVATPGFQPSRPLHRWSFERISGVPCFVAGDATGPGLGWTIFEGYGNPAYHHADAYNRKVTSWIDHGFRVIMVNTRGCSGFGRAWREGNVGRVGVSELEDLARVREALVVSGRVDARRTIIAGESWGGFMALQAMACQPELWRIGLAALPIADWTRITEEACPITWALTRSIFARGAHPTVEQLRAASPLTHVDGVRGPIRMDVGRDDLKCPPAPNRRFADALLARGVPCELDLFTGGHGAPDREESVRQIVAGLGFLFRHTAAIDAAE